MKIRREAKVGIFAVAMLLALYWGVSFIKGKDLFNRMNTYYAKYDRVNGLQNSSGVFIKGFQVGTVSSISYDPSVSDQVVVEFNIKKKYKVPENSMARIYSDGFLGSKAIELVFGDSGRIMENGDTLRTEVNKDFMETASGEIDAVMKKASDVMTQLNTTLGTVNEMLETNAKNIETTMGNLASASGAMNTLVVNRRRELESMISNLNTVSAVLSENSHRMGNILANVDGFTDSLSRADIPGLVSNLNTTVEGLNSVLAKVNDGDGSMNLLLTDDSLYNSLTEAGSNLSLLLEDLRQSPKRYVHFSLFGRRDKSEK